MKKYIIYGLVLLGLLVFLLVALNVGCGQSSSDTTTTTSGGGTTTTSGGGTTTTTSGGGTTTTTTSSSTTTTTIDPSSLTWTEETLISTGATGQYCFLAIDSSDKVHIAHYGWGGLLHTTNASGSWVTSTIEAVTIADGISLAIDSADGLHISYYTGAVDDNDLKYAYKASGGSWAKSTLDSTGVVGMFNSIDTDTNNKAHIAYGDLTGTALKYATNKSGSWQKENVDTSTTGQDYSSIVVESPTAIHISYRQASNTLYYVTGSYGSWGTPVSIDSGVGVIRDTSIALDSSNNVHIGYSAYQVLQHATNSSGSWVTETVPNSYIWDGKYASLAIDPSDNLYLSFYKDYTSVPTSAALKIALKINGTWSVSTIDSSGGDNEVGEYSSIALDSAGRVHIAYQKGNGSDLMYALGQ